MNKRDLYIDNVEMFREIDRTILDEDYNFDALAVHFTKWARQQMLKHAISTQVVCEGNNQPVISIPLSPFQNLHEGDEVKVIIIEKSYEENM